MRAQKQTHRGGGEVSKPAVWPLALVVVVDAPRLDRAWRVVEAAKPAPVQTFHAERAVEALDEHMLRRLPRMDEFQQHAGRACREADKIHAPAFVRLCRSGHRARSGCPQLLGRLHFFSQQVFHDLEVERLIGQEPLQPPAHVRQLRASLQFLQDRDNLRSCESTLLNLRRSLTRPVEVTLRAETAPAPRPPESGKPQAYPRCGTEPQRRVGSPDP